MKQKLRRTYHFFFNRPYWHLVNQRRLFFSRFVSSGDLVFDIGANVGDYSLDFLSIGAKVVAVEPNPKCLIGLHEIKRDYPSLTIYPAAAGESSGKATLHVGKDHALGTLSQEWIDTAAGAERFKFQNWEESHIVQVLTLDSLIITHGMPSFIKIDVEGFELSALKGLTRLPRCLSFEFNSEALQLTRRCLDLPMFRDCEYNFCIGQPDKLALARWVDSAELMACLSKQVGYGDVLVRASGY
jgi:FkbM family methyltransferase